MARNERTTPNDTDMPVDRPGDTPERRAPVDEPPKRKTPERDPIPNEPPQRAPTDPDIAQQGHIEAKDHLGTEQEVVAAANGVGNQAVEGP